MSSSKSIDLRRSSRYLRQGSCEPGPIVEAVEHRYQSDTMIRRAPTRHHGREPIEVDLGLVQTTCDQDRLVQPSVLAVPTRAISYPGPVIYDELRLPPHQELANLFMEGKFRHWGWKLWSLEASPLVDRPRRISSDDPKSLLYAIYDKEP